MAKTVVEIKLSKAAYRKLVVDLFKTFEAWYSDVVQDCFCSHFLGPKALEVVKKNALKQAISHRDDLIWTIQRELEEEREKKHV